jgi:hypothetical protein
LLIEVPGIVVNRDPTLEIAIALFVADDASTESKDDSSRSTSDIEPK